MLNSKIVTGLIALAVLGSSGLAVSANGNAPSANLDCGISTQTERGMLVVEGVLHSPTAMSGEYRFALKSQSPGGSTNISQGGQFSAAAGTAVSLGRVMVNAGSTLDVDFTISTDGKQLDCSDPLTVLS